MDLRYFAVTLLTLLRDSRGEKGIQLKNKLVEDIIKKIYNISTNTFSKVNPEDKEKALSIINKKLSESVKNLGPNKDKYIDIIMSGIKMATPTYGNAVGDSKSSMLRETTHYGTGVKVQKTTINDIVVKVGNLTNNKIHNVKIDDEKIVNNVWRRIADYIDINSQKHPVLDGKHSEIKAFHEHIQHNNINKVLQKGLNESRQTNISNGTINHLNKKYNTHEKLNNVEFNMVTENNLKPVTNSLPCETAIQLSCSKLQSAKKLFCPLDRKIIPINKLCDGELDCRDGYDERDCIVIASQKIKETSNLISEIEKSVLKPCSYTHIDNSILIKQNAVLGEILQGQLGLLQTKKNTENLDKKIYLEKKTVNEIAMVISSLSTSLEGSICPQHTNEESIINLYPKSNDLWDYDDHNLIKVLDIPNKKNIILKNCNCERGFCKKANCTTICRRICWQKYSLERWGCQAIIGGNNVAIDHICDGKLDCHDETDETGCAKDSQTKFDALGTYNTILTMLIKKASSKEYYHVRNRLLNLHNNIKTLQELSMKHKSDPVLIKPLRDACFAELVTIYESVLNKEEMDLVDDAHMFLLTINEKLVSALKLSHTGNDKIITMDGCYCRNSLCALPKCTRRCDRACAAEAIFSRYLCKQNNATNNVSVPIDAICDRRADCPQGDDEMDCKKDVCRGHNLLLLRYDIRGVGDKQKGTALGELLKSWKAKVVSTLMTAESTGRPTKAMVRDVITEMLRDLVATYASLDLTRRDNDYNESVLKEFTKISQRVIQTLKSCEN